MLMIMTGLWLIETPEGIEDVGSRPLDRTTVRSRELTPNLPARGSRYGEWRFELHRRTGDCQVQGGKDLAAYV